MVSFDLGAGIERRIEVKGLVGVWEGEATVTLSGAVFGETSEEWKWFPEWS